MLNLPSRILVLATALAACAPSLAHPLRVRPGLMGETGLVLTQPAGRGVVCDGSRCADGLAILPAPVPYVTIGQGAVIDETIGILGGGTMLARVDPIEMEDIPTEVGWRAFGLVTAQAPIGSLALGTELGFGGMGFTIGAEVRPGEDERWIPTFGLFHRWHIPWVFTQGDGRLADGLLLGAVSPTWEIGVRVGTGPVFVQYALSGQVESARESFYTFDTRTFSELRQILSLGLCMECVESYHSPAPSQSR